MITKNGAHLQPEYTLRKKLSDTNMVTLCNYPQLTTNINAISQRTFPDLNLTTKQWRTVSMSCVIEALPL